MAYSVVLSGRAKKQLAAILDDDCERYTARQQLEYVTTIEEVCQSLSDFPKKFEEIKIGSKAYRHFTYKAHIVFYRVFEERELVFVDAVLHGRQLPEDHL